jgi:hypothetical protein
MYGKTQRHIAKARTASDFRPPIPGTVVVRICPPGTAILKFCGAMAFITSFLVLESSNITGRPIIFALSEHLRDLEKKLWILIGTVIQELTIPTSSFESMEPFALKVANHFREIVLRREWLVLRLVSAVTPRLQNGELRPRHTETGIAYIKT